MPNTIPIYQVDAFTETLFKGNPAAVVPIDEWMAPREMQQIAMENNLSETAFIVQESENEFGIRWFTPETEVDLCGHATLAAAHVIMTELEHDFRMVTFSSNSGRLTVEKSEDTYWLDFPAQPPQSVPLPKLIPEAIGTIPIYAGMNVDLLLLLDSEQIVRQLKPNFDLISNLDVRGVIVTAESGEPSVDFVSRFFAPAVGVPEDPVTGSAHTVLTPFWSKKLGKKQLNARQISKRGGSLGCIDAGERVKIGGAAITYMKGSILV